MRKLLIFGKELALTRGAHYVREKMRHWVGYSFIWLALQRMHQPSADMSNQLQNARGLEKCRKGEMQLAIWPNILWNLDKYIFKLREIPLAIRTNTFDNLDKPVAQGSAQGLEKCGKGKKAAAELKRARLLLRRWSALTSWHWTTSSWSTLYSQQTQHRPVFLDAKSKLFITFCDISFYGTASFGYSSNFRFKIGH